MKYKSYVIVLLVLIASMILSACGGAVKTTNPPTNADDTGCNIEPPASPVTVNMMGWTFDIMNYYAEQMKKCNSVENLTVNEQLIDYSTVDNNVRLALSGGGVSPYDIVHGSNVEMIDFGGQGWLLPLNDLINKYKTQYNLDDISDVAWAGATIDGKIYGIPVDFNTLHLAYRSDLFAKYNLKVPTTYNEVIAACNALKAEPSIAVPFTMDVSAGWAWEIEFYDFIRSFGGDYLNADNSPAFNSPAGVAAATKMQEVVDACMGAKHLTYGYETSETAMGNGSIAFTQIWAANTISMVDPARSKFSSVIKFAPAAAAKPGGRLSGSSWFDYYYIPKNTKVDPDLIFRVIMETTKPSVMKGAATVGFVPRLSISQGLANGEAALTTIKNGAGIYPTNRAIILAQTALGNWMPFIGTHKMTPQEALDAAAKDYIAEATKQGYLK
jgi:sorbitol/mannitol transport system substrate-binding protein